MAAIQVTNGVNSASKRSAADVEKPMMWLKPLPHQEFKLQSAQFLPKASNGFSMPVLTALNAVKDSSEDRFALLHFHRSWLPKENEAVERSNLEWSRIAK